MTSNSPTISIIVPVYNTAKYLEECLNSLINQTFSDIEIICVNDGSPDGSAEILKSYQGRDKRIIVVDQKNAGLSAARNTGMRLAKGKYIGFVDSDDWIDNNFYEKLMQSAVEHDAEIAMGNVIWFYDHDKTIEERSWIERLMFAIEADVAESVKDKKKVIQACTVWNKIFLRKLVEENNIWFYEGLYWEDNPFTVISTIQANKVGLVKDVLYHVRKHEKSITGSASSDRKPFDIFKIMAELKKFFVNEKIDSREGYKYYYEDLLYFYYYVLLTEKVHERYKKEFYKRAQKDFNKLGKDKIEYLIKTYKQFEIFKNKGYSIFMITSNVKNAVYNYYCTFYDKYSEVKKKITK
ncbi:MAG: glycosyltransferase [Bacteroidetes bacterium]|nr:glycosyltransferase [Bacteroidota bacterium]